MEFERIDLTPQKNMLGQPPEVGEKTPVKSRSLKVKRKQKNRRIFSESALLDIVDWNFEKGYSYHCISGGDIDSLSFLKVILRQQSLDYLLLSTWCMSLQDVEQIKEWIETSRLKRVDAYCGEIFKGSYANEYGKLKEAILPTGGRVCLFKNHSKVFAGIGNKFSFAIESSANINTNPRTEQTVININHSLFKFYKDFYDGIKSFDGDGEWKEFKQK